MFSSAARVAATLLALSLPAAAQTAPSQAPQRRIDYGVRFGPSFTTLSSVEPFDDTAATAAFEPTLNFGGYATVPLTGALSFQPEVLFAARGHRIRDEDARPITTPSGELKLPAADRVVLVRYLEFPLLLRLSKRTHENTSVFAIAGPAFALRRGAVVRDVANAGRREDIADLVSGSNLSYIAGAGLQYRRWLLDARFTRGMSSIAAAPAALEVKTGAFSVLMGVAF